MATRIRIRQKRRLEATVPTILFLGISILGAGWMISSGSRQESVKPQSIVVAEFDTVTIPVPSKPVPAGVRGKDILFKYISFPKQQIPVGAIIDVSTITDATANTALPAELPLFEVNFSKGAHVSNPVIERIPPGMRAMTIRVDATTAVEGWAGSGALVDVLLITKEQTKVVAEKVRILSAERSVAPIEGAGTPSVPTTVTVLVTQEQCLAINTAIPMGKIAFALRSTQDEAAWNDAVYTAERLKGSQVASDTKRPTVSGFLRVKNDHSKNKQQFAFIDGRWIKADSVPTGFLMGQSEEITE